MMKIRRVEKGRAAVLLVSLAIAIASVGAGVAAPVGATETANNQAAAPHTAAALQPGEAVAIAVNSLRPTDRGLELEHPRHTARFESDGVSFQPRHGGPAWHWSFDAIASTATAGDSRVDPVVSQHGHTRAVSYGRGNIEERYLLGDDHVEQQFVITAKPAGDGGLVLAGRIECGGELEERQGGWLWRSPDGVVSLGNVRAVDAAGRDVPASLAVTAGGTRITVAAAALRDAAYPVTIDPEIGTNDFRLSDMGQDGDLTYDGQFSAAAFDNLGNRYLVVWQGDDDTAGLGDGQFEIFGQLVDAVSGAEILANDRRLSDMGPDGDPNYDASSPAVAFNATNREFFVVWEGDDNTTPLVNGESEIFAQRVSAVTGLETGTNDFRVSDMGPDGNPAYDAFRPAVAWSSTQNEYLVVWEGDDVAGALADDEMEIYGQRIAAQTGIEVGANDLRVSDMGPDGNPAYDAVYPAVAWGSTPNEYLVVWQGDDTAPLADDENEIFAQRITAATGNEAGTNDVRLSDMGPDGNPAYDALTPAVAYATGENEYLVVWAGDDNAPGLAEAEFEIYGQRVAATTGLQAGTNDMRLSDMGNDGDPLFDALEPAVAYNTTNHEYLVAWEGDDDTSGLGAGEYEIFGQRITAATGAQVGANDFRLTDIGTDGNLLSAALHPAITWGTTPGQYLVTFDGDDDVIGLADDEFEIWGQRVVASSGAETGVNDFRLSDMGPDGDIDYDATEPAAAYNPDANQYLVVWQGDDNTGTLVNGETEIFAQRIDALTGQELGTNDIRVSDMGPDGDPAWDAQSPAVAYNRVNHEYLVVWAGEENIAPFAQGEFEIYCQRLSGTTGAELGVNDRRISDMGPDGDANYDALEPAVSWNPVTNEYLVVWEADDATLPLVEGETEIFGQRLAGATATEVGANDLRISDMGSDGDANFDAAGPGVAVNTANGEYLVVWAGEDNTGFLVNGEFEIYEQRLTSAGVAAGTNDARLSDMGPDGDANIDAFAPALAFDPIDNQYLVVWRGEDIVGGLVPGEFEIFAQRVNAATGAEIGANDFRVSDMGPDGDALYDADLPAVSYSDVDREFLVVWQGDDNSPGLVNGEVEIFGQRLSDATGIPAGDNDFRLSDMGTDGDPLYGARTPAVARSSGSLQYLVIWASDDNTGVLAPNEFEIYGQRFIAPTSTGVSAGGATPAGTSLTIAGACPNPAHRFTRLALVAPEDGAVDLAVYDVRGRCMWRTTTRVSGAGRGGIEIDTSRWPSGVYMARVASGRGSATHQIMVIH